MLQINADDLVAESIRAGLTKALQDAFSRGYNNPFTEIMIDAAKKASDDMIRVIHQEVSSCFADPEFCEELKKGLREQIAKQVVNGFGGQLKIQVDRLKSDPVTRARIVTALDEIVRTKVEGT